MSSFKTLHKMLPNPFLIKINTQLLPKKKVSPEMWILNYFSKNCPKQIVAKCATVRPVWRPG
jgi:hypothetical protein